MVLATRWAPSKELLINSPHYMGGSLEGVPCKRDSLEKETLVRSSLEGAPFIRDAPYKELLVKRILRQRLHYT